MYNKHNSMTVASRWFSLFWYVVCWWVLL